MCDQSIACLRCGREGDEKDENRVGKSRKTMHSENLQRCERVYAEHRRYTRELLRLSLYHVNSGFRGTNISLTNMGAAEAYFLQNQRMHSAPRRIAPIPKQKL